MNYKKTGNYPEERSFKRNGNNKEENHCDGKVKDARYEPFILKS